MARLYGRCPRDERLIGRVPFGTWKTLTFVAGLRCDEMTAPLVIDGAMNGEIFLAYVEQCLAPTLNRGDIVVMDNLKAHMVAGVKEAIQAAGRAITLPAEILARSQSDRAVLQQTKSASAQSRRADGAGSSPSHRLVRAAPQRKRVRKLFCSRWICSNMNGICSSARRGPGRVAKNWSTVALRAGEISRNSGFLLASGRYSPLGTRGRIWYK